MSFLLVKPSVWYQFWALNLKEFLLISLNGKCDSRTSCLTFTQTVNRPLCPRKLGKQPSFPQKETYHWTKGEDISNGCSRQLLFNDNGKVLWIFRDKAELSKIIHEIRLAPALKISPYKRQNSTELLHTSKNLLLLSCRKKKQIKQLNLISV